MNDIDPNVSKYMSEISNKRKAKRGGFNDPKVQARILAKRKANAKKRSPKT